MKKGLMTTSALVAAGMFGLAGHADAQMMKGQNPVQLKVGGYMEQFVGAAFQRPKADEGLNSSGVIDQQTEAEIHFTGQARLDNGLQIRAHVEYEVAGSPGNMVDEETLTLRNGFGQVILGNEDPVSSLMVTGYATPFVTSASNSLTYDVTPWVPIPNQRSTLTWGAITTGALLDSKLESFDNDASKISYVSPRIGGLQVGVSYVPDSQQQLQQGGTTLRALPNTTSSGKNAGWNTGIAAAANYTFAVDAFKVGMAVGFERANGSGAGTTGGLTSSTDNPHQAGGGVRVDYGPYRAIVGYKRVWGVIAGSIGRVGTVNDTQPGPDSFHSQNGHMWMAGGLYRFGPNAVSFSWQKGYEQGIIGAPNQETLQIMALDYGRHLAPGIRVGAQLGYLNYSGQDSVGAVSGVPGAHGFELSTSFRLDF